MKKPITLLVLACLAIGIAANNSINNESDSKAPKEKALEATVDVSGKHKAFRCTGDRVIMRSGPGKSYPQVSCYGARTYLNKGDIVLPGYRGVKNGYRHVYIPNSDEDCGVGWVAVQYLKPTIWNDGYVY